MRHSAFIRSFQPLLLLLSVGMYASAWFFLIQSWSQIRIMLSQFWNRNELGCGCEQALSLSSHPIIYGALLILGCIAMLIIFAYTYSLCKQYYHTQRYIRSLSIQQQSHYTYEEKIYPILHIHSSSPLLFTHGIVHPRIYISSALYSHFTAQEREAALLHEIGHIVRFDIIKKYILSALSHTYWFIPYLRTCLASTQYIQEQNADTFALQTTQRSHLLSAVTKMIQSQSSSLQILNTSPAAISQFHADEARLRSLLEQPVQLPSVYLFLRMVIVCLSGILMLLILSRGILLSEDFSSDYLANGIGVSACIQEYSSHQLQSVTPSTAYCEDIRQSEMMSRDQ